MLGTSPIGQGPSSTGAANAARVAAGSEATSEANRTQVGNPSTPGPGAVTNPGPPPPGTMIARPPTEVGAVGEGARGETPPGGISTTPATPTASA